MNLQALPHLTQILEDTENLLKNNSLTYLFKREGEEEIDSYDFSFSPPVAEKTVERVVRTDLCTLCERRISYKPHQFGKENIREPFLVLIHNPFIDLQSENKNKKYYQDPLVNNWLFKIFQGVFGLSPENFLVREVLRCLFGREDVKNKQWVDLCSTHIQEDILQYSLQGILVLGEAAPLLFGKLEAQKNIAQVIQFLGKPTVISSGPSRLTYLQKKNALPETIQQEKRNIFQALSVFKKEVMKMN